MAEQTISPEAFKKNWKSKFFTIFAGQSLSLFGSSLVQFALVWYLTRQTGSATILATATLIAMLPQIVLGPFAGALVDRWDRRLVMIFADGGIALATLGLALLFYFGRIQIWHIYLVLLLRSAGGAFHWPAMSASTSLMVPVDQLSRVAGMQQTLMGLVSIVAPPTGALLISVIPTEGVLSIDILTAVTAILPLIFISIPRPEKNSMLDGNVKNSYFQDVKDGFRYVAAWPGLLVLILTATFINFILTPISALMPLLVTKFFQKGAFELGLTDSFWGIGMIIGGVVLSTWGGFKKRIITSLLGIAGLGLGVIVIGLAPMNKFWIALAGMTFIGIMNPITNGPLHAVLQSTVKPDMQGRVMSLLNSAATAMSPISLALAGPVSDYFDIRFWYIAGGIGTLFIGIAGFFIPALMHIEDNRQGQENEHLQEKTNFIEQTD